MIIPLDKLKAHGRVEIGDVLIAVVKEAVSIVSSTAAAKQSQLAIPVEAGATYLIEARLMFTLDGTASGYKFTPTGPASTQELLSKYVIDGANSEIINYTQSSFHALSGALAQTGSHEAIMNGVYKPSVDGEFYIQFGQFVSDSAAITLNRGSVVKLTKIG